MFLFLILQQMFLQKFVVFCLIIQTYTVAELHRCDGGSVEMKANDSSSAAPYTKHTITSTKATTDTVVCSASVPHSDAYRMGVPAQRSTVIHPRQAQRPIQKWKGPDKINRIYGDWIDDID